MVMFFFVEKIAIRRYESNMHLDVGKNLANSKNWKVSRPNAACVHSIWNNEHVFLSGYAKGAARWKGKPGLLYHLGLTEKQGNWKSTWLLVFHLRPAVDQFKYFNIFHPCFGSELFRFTRLTSISSSTFSSKLPSISLHLTEMKIEVSLLLRGRGNQHGSWKS